MTLWSFFFADRPGRTAGVHPARPEPAHRQTDPHLHERGPGQAAYLRHDQPHPRLEPSSIFSPFFQLLISPRLLYYRRSSFILFP